MFVSRRFFFYSLYGMIASSVFIDVIPWTLRFDDIWLAVIIYSADGLVVERRRRAGRAAAR